MTECYTAGEGLERAHEPNWRDYDTIVRNVFFLPFTVTLASLERFTLKYLEILKKKLSRSSGHISDCNVFYSLPLPSLPASYSGLCAQTWLARPPCFTFSTALKYKYSKSNCCVTCDLLNLRYRTSRLAGRPPPARTQASVLA